MSKPAALPVEMLAEIVKVATYDGDPKPLLLNLMQTNSGFSEISRRLLYRSVTLPDPKRTSLFFGSLARSKTFVVHLRFAYLPGEHRKEYGLVIGTMASLETITNDFADDCDDFDARNFGTLLCKVPGSLHTLRFISVNVYKSRVSLSCWDLATTLMLSMSEAGDVQSVLSATV